MSLDGGIFVEDDTFFDDPFFTEATFCWPREYPGGTLKVRSQQNTNACYAFAVVTAIHSEQILNKKGLIKASEQELLDHLHEYYPPKSYKASEEVPQEGLPNQFYNAFLYVMKQGLYSELQYPWKGIMQKFGAPLFDPDRKYFLEDYGYIRKVPLSSYYDRIDEQLRKQLLCAGIRVTRSLRKWKGPEVFQYTADELELINNPKIVPDNDRLFLHAVTLVGYGVEDGIAYYIIQNSYGPSWGYKGYIKMPKTAVGHVFYPIGARMGSKRKTGADDMCCSTEEAESSGYPLSKKMKIS